MIEVEFKYSRLVKGFVLLILLYGMHALTPKFHALNLVDMDLSAEVAALSGSNKLTQLLWVLAAAVGGIGLLRLPSDKWQLLSSVYLLPLYGAIVIALFGFIHSEYASIAFRRAMLLAISSFALLTLVMYYQRAQDVFSVIPLCFMAVVFLDLLAVAAFNGIDGDGFFRGIHGQKNLAGAIYSYFFIYFANNLKDNKNRFDVSCTAIAAILLLASVSKTAIALVITYILLWRLLIAFNVLVGLIISIVPLMVVGYFLDFYHLAGDELTGRGHIWQFLKYYSSESFWFGFGYGTFWGVGDEAQNVLYGEGYIQLINNAHNGYIDLLLSGGVLLLAVATLHLAAYLVLFNKAQGHPYRFFCGYCLFSLVIGNITESTLFSPQMIPWIISMLAFLSLLFYHQNRQLENT